MSDVLVVSLSQIKSYRKCKREHHYRYVENIERRIKKVQLYRGSVIHDLIKVHIRGGDWEKEFEKFERKFNKLPDLRAEYGDLDDEIWEIMSGYFSYYEDDPLEYLLVEEWIDPVVPLVKGKTAFGGIVDAIARDSEGRHWVVEHKTHDTFPTEEDRLNDLQTSLYVWALRKNGWKIDGILWDYIRTKPPAKPEVLKSGGLSKRKNIDTTYDVYLEAIKEHGENPDDYQDILESLKGREERFYRRVKLPVNEAIIKPIVRDAKRTSLEIYYLKEFPTRNLTFMCPRWCDFYQLCTAELRGLDTSFIREREYRPRKKRGED